MRQVVPPIVLTQKILGQQRMNERTLYRLSTHCMRIEQPEGVLLYHTLTGELILLTHVEAGQLKELSGPVPLALEELVHRWFLRPQGADDMALADQVRQIAEHFKKKKTALTRYSIFTTTACNARCFYCYETGWNKSSMSEQTALDTANYIAEHCGGKSVHLRWFGGEPLVNIRAIDVIADSLRQHGVEFRSTMTTNGYLFDEALVRRARNVWNLELAQITLDGTEEVYNRCKAYVNPEGSPFQRVLRNIGLLLDVGIQVKVRLNMGRDNAEDMYMLIDQLAERFARKPGFGVYQTLLWENTGMDPRSYTAEERRSYTQKLQSLRAYAEKKGIAAREPLRRRFAPDACNGDSNSSTTVTPEGRLGRCDSCMDGAIWGSIYSDEVDEEVIRQWKERKPPEEVCKDCYVYPQCLRLKKCPGWPERCSPIELARREDKLRRAVLGAYEDWKAAGQN